MQVVKNQNKYYKEKELKKNEVVQILEQER